MAPYNLIRKKIFNPLAAFMHDSRAIGIILLCATAISLVLSNLHFSGEWYRNIWQISFDNTSNHHIHFGGLILPNSIMVIINDGLMALFFFLAGMEIKRELVSGELSSLKQSLLPVMAAIGGMVIPAILYTQFNKGTVYMGGWAVPMATDIAFTLGVASLLGKKVPISLKIFITALAIIDDLGAIVVIALFYGGALKLTYLLITLFVFLILGLLQQYKIRFGWYNWVLSIVLWYAMFNSGIHATVAGVLFAFTIPVKQLSHFELKLHKPVYFIIMPLFALANTAILFPDNSLQSLNSSFSWGIIFGLVIGKPLGICGACYLMIKNKWSSLPAGTSWYQLIGAGILAGIGFTMSIFISTLAFADSNTQDMAKIAVLIASLLAMIIGYAWLSYNIKSKIIVPL
ncbi:MAG: Na+/H+ antiporter NhaA [Sphingobacteriia bacterium]|nr:MAG: Na+/H+ antiporter NhaA [Sphingobacteriia bacterium]TAH09281.1 MAG: Na+/H+ antiporter NhaA [Sphingobacteriia bacterium]